ncbi:unnamed protein product [Owenia fusiformis]|uniref:Uncharacterized protein n=1 Tax=Owenia fusiformis TaxID=6347 RepID=A0A8J1XI28_OWEFU|nr:unnamed protein product [Owenia fusiformis]
MAATTETQNWRLSRIEEELERLSFENVDGDNEMFPPPPPPNELIEGLRSDISELNNDISALDSSADNSDLLAEINSDLRFDIKEITSRIDISVNDSVNTSEMDTSIDSHNDTDIKDDTSNRDSAIEGSIESLNSSTCTDNTTTNDTQIDRTDVAVLRKTDIIDNTSEVSTLHYDVPKRHVTPEKETPNALGLIRLGSPKKDTTPKVEVVPIVTKSPHRLSSASMKTPKKPIRKDDPIYSSVTVSPKDAAIHKAIDREKEALRRISKKYDSYTLKTGFVENNVCPPTPSIETSSVNIDEQVNKRENILNKGVDIDRESAISEAVTESTMSDNVFEPFEEVTDHDVMQVEMFYKSHKSEVHVCPCLASLYFGKLDPKNVDNTRDVDTWEFHKSGIPVVILDSGESRRTRSLTIVLSEKGSGFILWKDVMNHLTNYKAPYPSFHTMHNSNDHSKLAGLSFETTSGAADFYRIIKDITSDPDDPILNLSGFKKKRKEKGKQKKTKPKLPKKAEISQPCGFEHITKLDRNDAGNVLTARDIEIKPKYTEHETPCGPKTVTIKKRYSNIAVKNLTDEST